MQVDLLTPLGAEPSSNGTDGPNAEEQHEFASIATITAMFIVAASIVFGYFAKKYHFYYLPESAFTLLLGLLIGGLAWLILAGKDDEELETLKFQPDTFFFLLLPPIIFEAGYSLRRKSFFSNFSTILLFAVLGTIISTFVIGFSMYGFAKAGLVPTMNTESPFQALMFGALISAVDPVATLAIMGSPQLNCDKLLYSLVFGESVLNDAVAIVLFHTFLGMTESGLDLSKAGSYFELLGKFIGISIGSIILGVLIGLGACVVFKFTNLRKYPSKEITLLIVFAYTSYALGEAAQLSGIMSIFFTGIVLSHYNLYNMSVETRGAAQYVFKALAHTTETAVFAYMGVTIFTGGYKTWKYVGASVLALLCCLVARAFNTFPLANLANLGRKKRIPCNMQFLIWFAGLRGAIAFALSLNMPCSADANGNSNCNEVWDNDIIVTMTLFIVVFTTVVAGGFTEPLLTRMNLRTGDAEEDETEELTATLVRKAASNRKRGGLHAWWHNVDEQYMKPCFSSEARSGGPSGSLVGIYTSSGGGGGGSGSGMEGSNGGSGYGQGTGMLRGSTGGYGSTTSSQDDDGDLGGGTAQGAALMGQSMTGLGSVGASLPASAAAAAAISGDIGTYQAPEDGDGDLGGAADAL